MLTDCYRPFVGKRSWYEVSCRFYQTAYESMKRTLSHFLIFEQCRKVPCPINHAEKLNSIEKHQIDIIENNKENWDDM